MIQKIGGKWEISAIKGLMKIETVKLYFGDGVGFVGKEKIMMVGF